METSPTPCSRVGRGHFAWSIGVAGALALTVTALGCPGTTDASLFGVCDAQKTVLQAKCATAGCHGAVDAKAGLDLASPDALLRLLGVPAATALQGGACEGAGHLVNPMAPAGGLLFDKLAVAPPCGQPMPPMGARLSDPEVTCLKRWVEAGIADAAVASAEQNSDQGRTAR